MLGQRFTIQQDKKLKAEFKLKVHKYMCVNDQSKSTPIINENLSYYLKPLFIQSEIREAEDVEIRISKCAKVSRDRSYFNCSKCASTKLKLKETNYMLCTFLKVALL